MHGTIGTGPVGTGIFARPRGSGPDGTALADLWWCVAFIPIVPLLRWYTEQVGHGDGEVVDFIVRARSPIPILAVLGQVGRAIGGVLLSTLMLAFGVATIGVPWATVPLRSVERVLLDFVARHPHLVNLLGRNIHAALPSVISMVCSAVGMAVETGVFLAGAAIPILVLMHFDLSMRRVPLRAMLHHDHRPAKDAEQAA